ncbi:MAG: sensor histidine kinase [Rhodoglobus sp.]
MSGPRPQMLSSEQAERGVARVVSMVLAAATVLFFVPTLSSLLDQDQYVLPLWQVGATVAVFGLPLVLAALSRQLSLARLRSVHGGYALVFVAAIVSWIPAFIHGPMPSGVAPWVAEMTALGTVSAALAWRPAIAWGYLIVSSLITVPVRVLAVGGELSAAVQSACFTMIVCAVFTAVIIAAVRAAHNLDLAIASERTAAMRAAALTGQAQEQAQLDALVHDEVISTIFAAAGVGGSDAELTRAQAARTIAHIAALRVASTSVPDVIQSRYFVDGLAAAVRQISAPVEFVVTGQRETTLASPIVRAFTEATTEALRNSVAHAGVDSTIVRRVVAVRLSETQIEVTITDTGKGFTPATVPKNRLGIAVSILGRVNSLPGAHATVWSQPGQGTQVQLVWQE